MRAIVTSGRWHDCAIERIRAALGILPVAEPADYRLYRGGDGQWHLCRDPGRVWSSFASRDQALAALHLSAARRISYSLQFHDSNECQAVPSHPSRAPWA